MGKNPLSRISSLVAWADRVLESDQRISLGGMCGNAPWTVWTCCQRCDASPRLLEGSHPERRLCLAIDLMGVRYR